MPKVRIYELAKKLNKQSKEILDELVKVGIEGKTRTSGSEEDIAKRIIEAFSPRPHKEKAVPETIKKAVEKPSPIAAQVSKPSQKKIAEEQKKPEPFAPEVVLPEVVPPDVELKPAAGAPETEDEVKLPDRFKKEIEAEKIEKFKAKPGLQRAFQTIRKIEPKKWQDTRGHKKGDKGRPGFRQDEKTTVLSTMPRKKTLKRREGATVKEFSELLGLKFTDVIKKFMELGYMPTINQPVDADAALLVAESFGIKMEIASVEEDVYEEIELEEDASNLLPRAPVVTARKVAARGIDQVFRYLGKTPPACTTDITPLHDGAIPSVAAFVQEARNDQPAGLSATMIDELTRSYGSKYPLVGELVLAEKPQNGASADPAAVIQAMARYAVRVEMAQKLADVVVRLTALGSAGRPAEPGLRAVEEVMAAELGWSEQRRQIEHSEVQKAWDWFQV